MTYISIKLLKISYRKRGIQERNIDVTKCRWKLLKFTWHPMARGIRALLPQVSVPDSASAASCLAPDVCLWPRGSVTATSFLLLPKVFWDEEAAGPRELQALVH